MTLRTSNQMLLKRLQSTDTYILTCCNSSTVSLTHVLHCTEGEKAAATAGEENWLKAWSLPSSENIFLFGFSFGFFFVEAKGMPQIGVAEHCGSGRKGAAPSSKLQQVKKNKQDGYAPFLSHPSQALRLLQLSHCAKQFALSCSLLRTFAMPQPPMVQCLLVHLSCCTVPGDAIELPMFLFTVTYRVRDLSLLQICKTFRR